MVALGGDWYDVIAAPDGRVVVSVGDIVGHGLTAVGMMARTSAAVRAYVNEGHAPAQILRRLNSLLCTERSALATAVVVRIDPGTGEVEYASAGHPYPLMRDPSGTVRVLEGAQGPILGATEVSTYLGATTDLTPDATLLLYTDGLIERREEPISTGQQRLAAALENAPDGSSSRDVVATSLHACLAGRPRNDDVSVVAVRRIGDNS
jgi:serine phosphatase RsbU (regulator of sigma subunit)